MGLNVTPFSPISAGTLVVLKIDTYGHDVDGVYVAKKDITTDVVTGYANEETLLQDLVAHGYLESIKAVQLLADTTYDTLEVTEVENTLDA